MSPFEEEMRRYNAFELKHAESSSFAQCQEQVQDLPFTKEMVLLIYIE